MGPADPRNGCRPLAAAVHERPQADPVEAGSATTTL